MLNKFGRNDAHAKPLQFQMYMCTTWAMWSRTPGSIPAMNFVARMSYTTPSNYSAIVKLMLNSVARQPLERTCKYVSLVHSTKRMGVTSCVIMYVDSELYRWAGVGSMSYTSHRSSLSITCSTRMQQLSFAHTLSLHFGGHCGSNSVTIGARPRITRPHSNMYLRFIKLNWSSMMKSFYEWKGNSMNVWMWHLKVSCWTHLSVGRSKPLFAELAIAIGRGVLGVFCILSNKQF